QILVNLLSNAAKYGASRPVAVSTRAEAGAVVITVIDSGIGIANGDLERVFAKFERAVSADNYAGLGLGLFVCRCLSEAMGGQISVSSALGHGSAFTLRFPSAGSKDGGSAAKDDDRTN